MILDSLFSLVSHDVGIDLGTSNTLVWVKEKGIIIREPSVVARHKKSKEILAIGSKAKKMIGKTPEMIEAIRPLKDGVIADFDASEAMIKKYIEEIHQSGPLFPRIPKPRVVIGINLPIEKPEGMLLVDIGGGTTEIAVISLGGIVIERCLRIAGDEMDEAVVAYMRLKYSLLLGEATAEEIKIQLGSAYPQERVREMIVRGRGLETGLPKSLKVGSEEIREAISPVVRQIVDQISGVIEETPPELVVDIVARGITLCGGGSQLAGLDKLIAEETKMPVWLADNPMNAVVRGCGQVLEDESLLKKVKVTGGLR